MRLSYTIAGAGVYSAAGVPTYGAGITDTVAFAAGTVLTGVLEGTEPAASDSWNANLTLYPLLLTP
jgi:hypothetical protein